MNSGGNMQQLTDRLAQTLHVRFDRDVSSTAKLIELSPDLLKLIEKGESLCIKGSVKEEAVLCTSNTTYTMKRVETSNTLLLVSPSSSSQYKVQAACKDYYEIKPSKGRLTNLRAVFSALLSENLPENELLSRLEREVFASRTEILSSLEKIGAVQEEDGHWTLIQPYQLQNTIKKLFDLMILNDQWKLSLLSEKELLVALSEDSTAILPLLRFVLSTLGNEIEGNPGSWELDKEKIAIAAVHLVFTHSNARGKVSNLTPVVRVF